MIIGIKLLLSTATVCFAVGYAARRRVNRLHRRLMAVGAGVAWLAAAAIGVGMSVGELPLGPAYWLVDVLGGAGPARIAAAVQLTLASLALVGVTVQAYLGWMRHPLHRLAARAVIPLWLLVYVSAMFFYY